MSNANSSPDWDEFLLSLQKDALDKIKAEKGYKSMEYSIEDAVSEMIRRYIEAVKTQEIRDPRAWVIKGAHNILISQHRKYKSSLKYMNATQRGNQHIYDPYETPPMDISLAAGMLKKHIHKLPDRCREVIKLHLAGKSSEEIARALNITEGTVRSHKSHAVHQILQYLQNIATTRKNKK